MFVKLSPDTESGINENHLQQNIQVSFSKHTCKGGIARRDEHI